MFAKILKYLTSIFAFINLIVGVIVTGIGIYLKANKPKFWTLIHVEDFDNQTEYLAYVWTIIGLGILTCISSVCGIFGGKYKNRCALTVYSIGIFLLFGCFLAIAICLQVLFTPFISHVKSDVNCNSDRTSLTFVNDSNQLYLDAHQQYFCRKYDFNVPGAPEDETQCTCYIKDKSVWTNKFGANFFDGYSITEDENKGVTNLNDCKYPEQEKQDMQAYLDLLNNWSPFTKHLEEQFQCSGVCDPQPFYFFSDINNGIPVNNQFTGDSSTQGTGCLNKIVSFLEKFSRVSLIVGWSASGFLFLNILLSICVCCIVGKGKGFGDLVKTGEYYSINDVN